MVHDAIAYAPYLHKTIYQSNIYGLRVYFLKNMNNKPDFQTEFIRFLKSRGYSTSGIFCNAKIGETHVDYLITLPNPNDNLVIIIAQRLNDNSEQLKQQIEMCRQEMGEPNYPVCLLTPNEKAQSKSPFSLYHLNNKGDFQEINFELLPTFQALLSEEIAKQPEIIKLSNTMEKSVQYFNDDLIDSHKLNLTDLNHYEIAALRNGRKGVIQTALFNLYCRKELFSFKTITEPYNRKIHSSTEKVSFRNIAKVTKCVINDSPIEQPEGRIEEVIYQFAQESQARKPTDFFTDQGLRTTLDKLIAPINQKLIQKHQKPSPLQIKKEERKSKHWFYLLGFVLLSCFIGIFVLLYMVDNLMITKENKDSFGGLFGIIAGLTAGTLNNWGQSKIKIRRNYRN